MVSLLIYFLPKEKCPFSKNETFILFHTWRCRREAFQIYGLPIKCLRTDLCECFNHSILKKDRIFLQGKKAIETHI